MRIDRAAIRDLIPHSGAMCLLDEVATCDAAGIRCIASSHRDPDNPLRRAGRLGALCGIEYAAQAMALHGAVTHACGSRARAGLLASVREVVCAVDFLDDRGPELEIEAQPLLVEGARMIYAFRLRDGAVELLRGRAAVVLEAPAGAV
ncbi:MAG TPA: hydroxymyristoyl-ACP dehydratase [Burkholderiales bacterium]|nr:hydroxymyristoyl-ACP dehydratase [Burkholderiales bacterium]